MEMNFIDESILSDLMSEDRIPVIRINAGIVVKHDIQPIVSLCEMIISKKMQAISAGRLAIEWEGYHDDIRDPVTIPEVRQYIRHLNNSFGIMPFFLENEKSSSLVRYAACICDNWFEGDEFFLEEEQLDRFLEGFGDELIRACDRWRIDPVPHLARIHGVFERSFGDGSAET